MHIGFPTVSFSVLAFRSRAYVALAWHAATLLLPIAFAVCRMHGMCGNVVLAMSCQVAWVLVALLAAAGSTAGCQQGQRMHGSGC